MDKLNNLLVIGGTGFIGYHIIKSAKKKGFRITSISLNKPKKIRYLKKIKYIKADISNFRSLKKKMKTNYDFVVNAGGYGAHPDFGKKGNKLIKSHFNGLINILRILDLKKVKKFVQIGSSAEYGNINSPLKESAVCKPNTPYAVAKLLCTNILQELYLKSNFPVTILRFFQVYGPHQDDNRVVPFLINKCIKDKKFSTTKGNQLCDFCYIDDAIDAIFKSLNKKKSNGEIINIGSGSPIKIKKLIKKIVKLAGKGRPEIGILKYKKGTNMKNFASIYKAKKKLGWQPNTKLHEGFIKTINYFKL